MKKVIVEFTEDENGYFDQEEVNLFLNASSYKLALNEIRNEIFRPARKHGYSSPVINELLEKCGGDGIELIYQLECLFGEILDCHDIIED